MVPVMGSVREMVKVWVSSASIGSVSLCEVVADSATMCFETKTPFWKSIRVLVEGALDVKETRVEFCDILVTIGLLCISDALVLVSCPVCNF